MSYFNKKLIMPGLWLPFCTFLHEYEQEFSGSVGKENNLCCLWDNIGFFFCPFLHVDFYYYNTLFGGRESLKIYYLRRKRVEHKLIKNKSVNSYLPISVQIKSPKEEFTIHCLIWVIFHPFSTRCIEAPPAASAPSWAGQKGNWEAQP